MDLEKQAPQGRRPVHALLGNHEVMNMLGDLRYVSPEDYASYPSIDSRGACASSVYPRHRRAGSTATDPAVPVRVDGRAAARVGRTGPGVRPEGKYGRWLRQHDTVVKIGDHAVPSRRHQPEVRDAAGRRDQRPLKTASPRTRRLPSRC